MKLKSLRNTLVATTAVSSALIAGIGVWTFFGPPLDMPSLEVPQVKVSPSDVGQSNLETKKRNFDGLLNVGLQPPRDANFNAAPSPMISNAPGFSIQLLGTMIDTKRSLAVFRDATGAFDSKGIGQPLELSPEGVKVESIEPGFATLLYAGKLVKLELATSESVKAFQTSPLIEVTPSQTTEEMNTGMQSSESTPAMGASGTPQTVVEEDLDFLPDNMNVYKMKASP